MYVFELHKLIYLIFSMYVGMSLRARGMFLNSCVWSMLANDVEVGTLFHYVKV